MRLHGSLEPGYTDGLVNPLSHEVDMFGLNEVVALQHGHPEWGDVGSPYCPPSMVPSDAVCFNPTPQAYTQSTVFLTAYDVEGHPSFPEDRSGIYKVRSWVAGIQKDILVLDHHGSPTSGSLPAGSVHERAWDVYYIRPSEEPGGSGIDDPIREYRARYTVPAPGPFSLLLQIFDVHGASSSQWSGTPLYVDRYVDDFSAQGVTHAVRLEWIADRFNPGTEFEVYRSTDGGCSFPEYVGSVLYEEGPSATEYEFIDNTTDTDLVYYYRIRDTEGGGYWGFAGAEPQGSGLESPSPPGVPGIGVGQGDPAGGTVVVSVSAPASSLVSGYTIYYDTDGPPYAHSQNISCQGTSLTLTPYALYHFAAKAWNGGGASSLTQEQLIRPLPTPTGVEASGAYKAVTVTLPPVSFADSYIIRIRTDDESFDETYEVAATAEPSYEIGGLSNGVTYLVTVQAVDAYGHATTESDYDTATPYTYMGLETELSSLEVRDDRDPVTDGIQLTTCPDGGMTEDECGDSPDVLAILLRLKTSESEPIQGIPASAVEITITLPSTAVVTSTDETCTPSDEVFTVHPDDSSDSEGRMSVILHRIRGHTGASPNLIRVSASVGGIPLPDIELVEIRSPDNDGVGGVDLVDFGSFATAFTSQNPLFDFDWKLGPGTGGIPVPVGLSDFGIFASHWGNACHSEP